MYRSNEKQHQNLREMFMINAFLENNMWISKNSDT